MKSISKQGFRILVSIFLTLGLSVSFQGLLAQWAAPTQNPPGGNVYPPVYNVSNNPSWITVNKQFNAANGINVSTGLDLLSGANLSLNGNWVSGDGDNEGIFVNNSGNVGIGKNNPSARLDVNGSVRADSFVYSSDKELKKEIRPISDALAKIKALNGVSFVWKNNHRSSLGFIAQDLEKVLPELVSKDENTGLRSVEYGNITAVLVEALKEQSQRIDELEKLILQLNENSRD
jgi:hypothetical protein